MATTTGDNLWSPDLGTAFVPTVDLAHMQDTVQTALNNIKNQPKNYIVGTNAQRVALSGVNLFKGLKFYATDTNLEWFYNGTAWQVQDSGWINLTLAGGWINFGGGVYADAQYRKLFGVVFVRGLIKSGTTTPGGTIATLPVGYRPNRQSFHPVAISGGTGQVEVAADGRILHSSVSTAFTALELRFPADQ